MKCVQVLSFSSPVNTGSVQSGAVTRLHKARASAASSKNLCHVNGWHLFSFLLRKFSVYWRTLREKMEVWLPESWR